MGAGLLLGRFAPLLLWPAALALLAVWLGRWPKPGVWLLAATFSVILVGSFAKTLEPKPSGSQLREVSSTSTDAQTWGGVRNLSIRNSDGNISVTGGSSWRLRARYRWGAEARARRIPGELVTAQRGRTLDFTGLEPSWSQGLLRGAEAQLRARVPRATTLSVEARSSDVKAQNLASAHIEINLGDVTLSNVAGAAVAVTDVGNVFMTDVGGGIEAKTLMGDVWLEPRPSPAPILARADVGDIALVLPFGTDARIVATSTSRGLPENFKRVSPTQGELVLGNGSRMVVLTTRVGKISLVQR